MVEAADDKVKRKLAQSGMDGYLKRDEDNRQAQARRRTDNSHKQEQAKKRMGD